MTEANSTTPPAPPADDPRVAELEAENARLREQLVAAGQKAEAGRPHEPSFKFSAGEADELERLGRTQSPFTGKLYVGTSTADAREATAEEFAKAKPPKAAKGPAAKPAAQRSGRSK